ACRSGASSGTVTGVARMSVIFIDIQRDKLTLSLDKTEVAQALCQGNTIHPWAPKSPKGRHDSGLGQTPLNELNPPSIGMMAPVTKDAASLASHRTAPTSSSGLPNRPIGVRPMIDLARSV